MGFHLADWFMLFGVVCPLWAGRLSEKANVKNDWNLTIENDVSRKQSIQILEREKKLSWLSFAIALIVVIQGIYLIHSGYSVDFYMSGE